MSVFSAWDVLRDQYCIYYNTYRVLNGCQTKLFFCHLKYDVYLFLMIHTERHRPNLFDRQQIRVRYLTEDNFICRYAILVLLRQDHNDRSNNIMSIIICYIIWSYCIILLYLEGIVTRRDTDEISADNF